jgi:hypothetical protein
MRRGSTQNFDNGAICVESAWHSQIGYEHTTGDPLQTTISQTFKEMIHPGVRFVRSLVTASQWPNFFLACLEEICIPSR